MDRQDGAAVEGRALSRRLRSLRILLVCAALFVCAAIGAGVLLAGSGRVPAPVASGGGRAVAQDRVEPPAVLSATASASDAFDAWSHGRVDSAARFLASDEAYQGAASLFVTRSATDASRVTAELDQVLPVAPGRPLVVRFVARSSGSPPGAVQFRVSAGGTSAVALPSGAFGWTTFTTIVQVPRSVRAATLQVLSTAPTSGVWIDDITAQGAGSQGIVVQNAGFEQNSADLSVTNASLVFSEHQAQVDFRTRRAPTGSLRWRLLDEGRQVGAGEARLNDWRAAAHLAAPPGYYTLAVTADIAQSHIVRSTGLVIVPADGAAPDAAFGVGVHPLGRPAEQNERLIADLAAVGVGSARLDAPWARIETSRGVYAFPPELDEEVDALHRHGLRPLLLAAYENPLYDGGRNPSSDTAVAAYGRYAAALAAHYPDADIDVWNEYDFRPNTGRCGPSPTCYLRLLLPAAAGIREANPSARISAPSTAGNGINFPWLQGFLTGGGAGQTDAVSVHPYTDPAPPDPLGNDIDRLNAMIRAVDGGRPKPVWFTEIGWSTVPGGVSQRQQADYLIRTMAIAHGHGVQRVYWYDALNDSALPLDRESNFGLFSRPNAFSPNAFVPKPAVAAEAVSARFLAGSEPQGRDSNVPSGVVCYRFLQRGEQIRVVWSEGPTDSVTVRGGGVQVESATGNRRPGRADRVVDLRSGPVIITGQVTAIVAGEHRLVAPE